LHQVGSVCSYQAAGAAGTARWGRLTTGYLDHTPSVHQSGGVESPGQTNTGPAPEGPQPGVG